MEIILVDSIADLLGPKEIERRRMEREKINPGKSKMIKFNKIQELQYFWFEGVRYYKLDQKISPSRFHNHGKGRLASAGYMDYGQIDIPNNAMVEPENKFRRNRGRK